jgi:hypothetical protein
LYINSKLLSLDFRQNYLCDFYLSAISTVYLPLSVVANTSDSHCVLAGDVGMWAEAMSEKATLKGLSHEMDLAFDDMYG